MPRRRYVERPTERATNHSAWNRKKRSRRPREPLWTKTDEPPSRKLEDRRDDARHHQLATRCKTSESKTKTTVYVAVLTLESRHLIVQRKGTKLNEKCEFWHTISLILQLDLLKNSCIVRWLGFTFRILSSGRKEFYHRLFCLFFCSYWFVGHIYFFNFYNLDTIDTNN